MKIITYNDSHLIMRERGNNNVGDLSVYFIPKQLCITAEQGHVNFKMNVAHFYKVLLFIVAPESAIYDQLSQVDKSEYEVLSSKNDGMANVDFSKLLAAIGKSVSVSNLQETRPPVVERGLFGQASWGATNEAMSGA